MFLFFRYASEYMSSEFQEACRLVSSHVNTLNDHQKLEFYGLYKQSTEGDFKGSTFSLMPHTAAKNEAWYNVRGMTSADAKLRYIELSRGLSQVAH